METTALFEYGLTTNSGLPLGTQFNEKKYFVSDGYYAFLRVVMMETEWCDINIMQTIPTNLTNDALGYFYIMDFYEVESGIEE